MPQDKSEKRTVCTAKPNSSQSCPASFIRQKPLSLALWQCPIYLLICFSALLDVLVFYGLAFTHQIGADRDLSGFECGFNTFEECFFDSVRWWAT